MTNHSLIDADLSKAFRTGAWVYPHPVAVACGRLLRARSPESLVDAAIKGGEVLTRYLALTALASYAARSKPQEKVGLEELDGALSFGHFLTLARELTRSAVDHPVRDQLAAGLKPKGKGKQQRPGPTDEGLEELLNLRNELGHELSSLSRSHAETVLERREPVERLATALGGVSGILALPLFVVEAQQLVKKKVVGRRLLLMGETGDPEPEAVTFDSALEDDGVPYLGIRDAALRLDPMIVWQVAPARANYSLFVLDAVLDGRLKYKAIETEPVEANGRAVERLRACLQGESTPGEELTLEGGVSPTVEWRRLMRQREKALKLATAGIRWDLFDDETVTWFASRIGGAVEPQRARQAIVEQLLDGRDTLESREEEQLNLLLGTETTVRTVVRRPLLDLRIRVDPDERWRERVEEQGNVLRGLRVAVDFFGRHQRLSEIDIDGLRSTTGSADYVAMREALVNLFIHQDYTDFSAAAQVELEPDRATFFNPGHSLVGTDHLIDGGKSQARNPLIARALRLLGFAELAGSGVRAVQSAWRNARRRPPRFESDPAANSFILTLDWRKIPDTFDEIWKDRIGVRLSPQQAEILNLAVEAEGLTVEEAASGAGLRVDEAREALAFLRLQELMQAEDERWHLAEHLRVLLNDPGNAGAEEGEDG